LVVQATNTSITAYGIATKKPLQCYLMAVTLHFLINSFAQFDPFWFMGMVSSFFLAFYLYMKTTERIVT